MLLFFILALYFLNSYQEQVLIINIEIMKKLMFTAVLALGSLTAFAFSAEEIKTTSTEVVITQDGFNEIAASELPAAVTEAVTKNYPSATISKASVNDAKQYKLEVAMEDGTSGVLYADENGNWIEL